jgi:hypothetical protein
MGAFCLINSRHVSHFFVLPIQTNSAWLVAEARTAKPTSLCQTRVSDACVFFHPLSKTGVVLEHLRPEWVSI